MVVDFVGGKSTAAVIKSANGDDNDENASCHRGNELLAGAVASGASSIMSIYLDVVLTCYC